MKIKIITSLFVALMIIPSVASASWWNPISWVNSLGFGNRQEKTETLEKKIQELEAKLASTTDTSKSKADTKEVPIAPINNTRTIKTQAQIDAEVNARVEATLKAKEALIASQQKQPPAVVQNPTPVNTGFQRPVRDDSIDLGKYNELNVSDYIKNSKASFGKPVKIMSGVISGFNQGDKNYIEIIDTHDTSSSPKSIELLVENDNDYTRITNELSKWDRILVYGFGEDSTKFTVKGNGGSYESYEPVISVDAVYKCKSSYCRYPYDIGIEKLFIKKI